MCAGTATAVKTIAISEKFRNAPPMMISACAHVAARNVQAKSAIANGIGASKKVIATKVNKSSAISPRERVLGSGSISALGATAIRTVFGSVPRFVTRIRSFCFGSLREAKNTNPFPGTPRKPPPRGSKQSRGNARFPRPLARVPR